MNDFFNSIAITLLVAFAFAIAIVAIRLVVDKGFRKSIKIKEKKHILTSKEYYTKILGIMAIVYGGAIITINSPPISSEFEYVMLSSGMIAIIIGAQLEITSHKKTKQKLMDSEFKISRLEDRIKKLEEKVS